MEFYGRCASLFHISYKYETLYSPRSVSKSEEGLFVVTHRWWSCTVSAFHAWLACLARIFPLMWFRVRGRISNHSLSHGGMSGAADVFGVILAAALAWLSCLTRRPDASNGGGGASWVTQIAPEGDKEFDLVGTREYKNLFFLRLSHSDLLSHRTVKINSIMSASDQSNPQTLGCKNIHCCLAGTGLF